MIEGLIKKADVLIEALPYIRAFRDKIVVIKYGGSVITSEGEVDSVLEDIVFMETVGMKPVIVHGGSKAISRRMAQAGIEPRFVNGLRVTDEATMQIAERTLFEEVNSQIVKAIEEIGGRAMGISAKAEGILKVRKYLAPLKDRDSGEVKMVDIGYVGYVESVEPEPIKSLCEQDVVPVIAPIGLGPDGRSYNVNADTAAGQIAAALKAEKLLFLTDVMGIMRDSDDEGSLLSTLHADAVDELIEKGVISGGMLPKIESCLKAVKSGTRKTHIIDGRVPHSLLLEIFTDRGIGTQILG